MPYKTKLNKKKHAKPNNTIMTYTQSFFKLKEPNFAWQYIYTVPMHLAIQNHAKPNQRNNGKMAIT